MLRIAPDDRPPYCAAGVFALLALGGVGEEEGHGFGERRSGIAEQFVHGAILKRPARGKLVEQIQVRAKGIVAGRGDTLCQKGTEEGGFVGG